MIRSKSLFASIILIFYYTLGAFSQCTELLWEDNFDSSQLDSSKWTTEANDFGGGNNELQYYTNRSENVAVENGTLKITALKENYLTREYTSGKIKTQYKGDWKYGRIEARIKMPEGKGIWPAFWMLPTSNVYGSWPNSGEIDIVELVGGTDGDKTIYGTLHYGPPWQFTNGVYQLEEGKFSDDFHVFAIEWSPDTIKWFVDTIIYSMKTESDVTHWLPFQEKFYLMLNLAVGGNWPGYPDETTVFPQVMEVDYVRVFGKPEDQDITQIDSAYTLSSKTKFSFSQVPGAVFTWSVGGDSYPISGIDSNVFAARWGCDSATVQLNVQYPVCGSFNYLLPVNLARQTINGPFELLQKTPSQLFSLPAIDSTTYNWTFPEDITISIPDTHSVNVDWACSAGYVKVNTSNRCGDFSDSIYVSIIEPILTGPPNVVENSEGVYYSITPLNEASYSWSVPVGALIAEGQGMESISVNFGDSSGLVKVIYENGCNIDSLFLQVKITDTIMLCDYESAILLFQGWDDGVEPSWIENPFKDEVNNSSSIGMSFKASSPWSGLYADLGYNVDLAMHNRFSILARGPKNGTVLFKIEDVGEGIPVDLEDTGEYPPFETGMEYTEAGQWQHLTFDFTGVTKNVYDRITLFFDFGDVDTNTYFFDNIVLLPSDTIYANQSNIDVINEGSEDGRRILATLSYDRFVDNINQESWQFENLPEGVSVGSIELLSADSVLITLSGNRTVNYSANITNFTTIIPVNDLQKSQEDLILSTGVVFTALNESSLVAHSEKDLLKIYPNPSKGMVHLSSPKTIIRVELLNTLGQMLELKEKLSSKVIEVDLSAKPSGLYLLKVTYLDNTIQIINVVKQ